MTLILRRLAATALIAAFAVTTAALHAQAPAGKVVAHDSEVTGQHRGYTNSQLYLRRDDDQEMTFTVRIPGDTTDEWQKKFATLSRITVTYHEAPGEKHPIATAIRVADAKP